MMLHRQSVGTNDPEIFPFAGELEVRVEGTIGILTVLCRGKDEESLSGPEGQVRKGPFFKICRIVCKEPPLKIDCIRALIE